MTSSCDRLRDLCSRIDELPAGEACLVDYLARLAPDRWDGDCEVTANYILDRHRTKLSDLGLALPPPESDLGVIVPAAERVRRKAEAWQQGKSFTEQVIAALDSVGGTRMILVVLPKFQPRLVEELKKITGYQYQRTFKQHNKVALYPVTSALEVVMWCRRRNITPSPDLEELAGPVGEQLDPGGDPDVTLTDDGWLRVGFPFDWNTIHDLKATFPVTARHYDRVAGVWLIRVEHLNEVIAFADRWALFLPPATIERARALPGVS